MSGDDLSQFSLLELFRAEAETQLAQLTEGILRLEQTGGSGPLIEPLMRAAHSLKGAARIVGLDAAVRVAHALEDCFVAAQKAQVRLTSEHVDTLLRCVDWLHQVGQTPEAEFAAWSETQQPVIDGLIAEVTKIRTSPPPAPPAAAVPVPAAPTPAPPVEPPQPVEVPPPVQVAPVTPFVSDPPGPSKLEVASTTGTVVVSSDPPGGTSAANRTEVASAGTEVSRAIAGPIVLETAPAAPPSTKAARSELAERAVRVSADSLTRLLGLAGETLVESRRLRPLADALLALRQSQSLLCEQLQGIVATYREPGQRLADEDRRSLAHLQRSAQECRQQLQDRLDEFEEMARRGEDLASRLHREVISSRMRPVADGLQGFPRMIRDIAKQLGKQVQWEVVGERTGVDRDILEQLEAPLGHLIRNAIDHGLELPEERQAQHKPPAGTITFEARHRAGLLHITLRDDGRGIDLQRLRIKIVQKGLTSSAVAERLTEAELLEFLFLPGFSTADQVTDVSGRGVGLDVVQAMVKAVGGMCRVQTQHGQGTQFHLQLPLTLSVVRALLVVIAGEEYAFPLTRLESIQRVPRGEVQTLEGRPHFLLEGTPVGLVEAAPVLGFAPPANGVGELMPVVVLGDRGLQYGLIVEGFLGERDLVLQPLDARLGKVPNIATGALLEDGRPALIVDVDDLLRSIEHLLSGRRMRPWGEASSENKASTAPRILVVDDSMTVRELERQLLESQGYQVDMAVDGMDGWNAVRAGDYDLVVSDVDMPRLDGIQLVRLIRDDVRLRTLPVVVVSYKDRSEDRLRGLEAGANAYLTKGSFHDRTFLQTVIDLLGEGQP